MFSPDAPIAIYLPDVREALDFYTDKLGFKAITVARKPGSSRPSELS